MIPNITMIDSGFDNCTKLDNFLRASQGLVFSGGKKKEKYNWIKETLNMRFDTQGQIDILNELYDVLRLYTNFFLPVQKLKEKVRIGSKVIKKYDKPKTPYQRILEAEDVSEEIKDRLKKQYQTLNLVLLKRQFDKIIAQLKPTKIG